MSNSNPAFTNVHDVDAIRAVFEELAAAWNRADGTAYGLLFSGDADYIDVTGTHTVGGKAIGQLHQFLFDGPLKGSRIEDGSIETAMSIDFLAPNVAIVIGGGTTRLQEQSEAPPRPAIN